MHLVVYIGYLEPYMLLCQNLYAFYFVCTRFLQSWHPIEDYFQRFLTLYYLYEW